VNLLYLIRLLNTADQWVAFLRTTAVPTGTVERILAMAILSVCHDPVRIQAQVR